MRSVSWTAVPVGKTSPAMPATKTSQDIRSEVCDITLAGLLGAGFLALLASLARSVDIGWRPVMALHVVIVATVAVAYLFRSRIPVGARAAVIIGSLFIVGVNGLLVSGSPYGLPYLVSAGIMAALIFGERAAVAVLVAALFAMAGAYAAFRFALLMPPDPSSVAMNATTWISHAANMMVAAFGPVVASTHMRRRLEAERRRAEQANAVKSDFLAMVSHELRTPMTGILGIADLLAGGTRSPAQAEQVSRLRRSARALLELLNELLDFAKIEANRLVIDHAPFNLRELFAEVETLFAPLATGKGIGFRVVYPRGMTDGLIGSPSRLRQVLINVIGNAIKFTDRGHVEVHVAQKPRSDGGVDLAIIVSDTGVGIASQHHVLLFQPFVQVDPDAVRRSAGTGLGLAITRRLLELLGGRIDVSSEAGVGSVFSITLPMAVDRGGPAAQAASAPIPGTASRALRVLVVDDNETSRYVIEAMLVRWGHDVECVDDGAAAVARIKAGSHDVVLMDVHMPGLDGVSATREIRQCSGPSAQVPIIGLTADVLPQHQANYLAAGMNAVVGKPVTWAELSAALDQHSLPTADHPAEFHDLEFIAMNSSAGGDSPFDETAIAALEHEIGVDSVVKLLPSFRKSVAESRNRLEAAAAAGDVALVRRTAHTLRGLCAQFGASDVAALAQFLEAETSDIREIREMMIDMTNALAALDQAVIARYAGMVGSGPGRDLLN